MDHDSVARAGLALLGLALTAACDRDPVARAGATVEVALVDSVRFENELVGVGYLRRVAVRAAGGVDTLEGVATDQEPVLVGDSVVYGLVYDQQSITGAFAYDMDTRAIRRLTLPEQLFAFSVPRFSPDGRHLAYLAMDTSGLGAAAVAEWPSARVIYRGPPVRLLETDVPVDAVRWGNAREFETTIEMSHFAGGGAQRTRGTVGELDSVVVDTVRR